jgi:deoxycytidine triphosphate deaminase
MILGPKKLLQLVKTKKLVEGLSERELTNPEGAGFDLRLGEVYKIKGEAFLGETHRKTPEIELVASYENYENVEKEINQPIAASRGRGYKREAKLSKIHTKSVTIKPGDFFLVKTIESVNMPANLTASITPRSTTYRSGLFIRTGNVPPGYCGGLIFGLKNEGPITVEIEMGARIVHIQFSEVKGGGSLYRGQWQGGRVTTRKKEKQV